MRRERAEQLERWMRSLGWASCSAHYEVLSIKGPWEHPHHDGRPMLWWDATQPTHEVLAALAPLEGVSVVDLTASFEAFEAPAHDP